MLLKRIITAIILIPLVLGILFYASPLVFGVATAIIMLLAAFEWTNLMAVQRPLLRTIYLVFFIFFLALSLFIPMTSLLILAAMWWLLAAVLVILYPQCSTMWGQSIILRAFMSFLTLIPCWAALNFLRNTTQGVTTLLFLFILIWGADTGAYFVGKKWGKHCLAKHVSPGKSWEGLMGALITSLIIITTYLYLTGVTGWLCLWAIVLALVTVLFSVLGDLFESMLKRKVNLKDSGRLLPGHGGLLDRIDSLTAAAPIFACGVCLINLYYK